jgi:hypothetical protein
MNRFTRQNTWEVMMSAVHAPARTRTDVSAASLAVLRIAT